MARPKTRRGMFPASPGSRTTKAVYMMSLRRTRKRAKLNSTPRHSWSGDGTLHTLTTHLSQKYCAHSPKYWIGSRQESTIVNPEAPSGVLVQPGYRKHEPRAGAYSLWRLQVGFHSKIWRVQRNTDVEGKIHTRVTLLWGHIVSLLSNSRWHVQHWHCKHSEHPAVFVRLRSGSRRSRLSTRDRCASTGDSRDDGTRLHHVITLAGRHWCLVTYGLYSSCCGPRERLV